MTTNCSVQVVKRKVEHKIWPLVTDWAPKTICQLIIQPEELLRDPFQLLGQVVRQLSAEQFSVTTSALKTSSRTSKIDHESKTYCVLNLSGVIYGTYFTYDAQIHCILITSSIICLFLLLWARSTRWTERREVLGRLGACFKKSARTTIRSWFWSRSYLIFDVYYIVQ